MKTFRCTFCGHQCELKIEDHRHPPEYCVVDGTHECYWKQIIELKRTKSKSH